jgi:hypothetical protein
MSVIEDGWDRAVSSWVKSQEDIKALVQIGSRVQKGATSDVWSDYDYQIITSAPSEYADGSFTKALGNCWASGSQTSFGNVRKVTAVYEGALEADFVILGHFDMLVATFALRWPSFAESWPRPLRQGIRSLRIVAAPGWKIIKGGPQWESRYSRITALEMVMTEAEFTDVCGEFWTQAVWAAKKAARGEFLASQRAVHFSMMEAALRLFQVEAAMDGRQSYPLGRRAEKWLSEQQNLALARGTNPERASLIKGINDVSREFEASSNRLAQRNHWRTPDTACVREWLARFPN